MADLNPIAPAPPAPAAPDLAALRAAIDEIDDAMHDLLMRRAALAAGMAAGRVKGGGPTFRPAREAAILRRLLARHAGPLPRPVVARLWRDIIASSLAQQGPFSIACFGDHATRAAQGHFGLLTPLAPHATPQLALAALAAGDATVAILPAPGNDEPPATAWWCGMDAPRLQVVAALPFLGGARPQALAVAPMPPEPSGQDRTLLRFHPYAGAGHDAVSATLSTAGLTPRHLTWSGTGAVLAELDGFLDHADPRLAALPFPSARVIGAFAEPLCDTPARPNPGLPEEPPA